jgi:sulfatase maturation enzyme AslB (radical SAM superfamily)
MSTQENTSNPTWEDIIKAITEIVQYAVFYKMKSDSKLIQNYKKVYKEIMASEDSDEYLFDLASRLYPNRDIYDQKMKDYKEWYKFKPLLLKAILKLHSLYYTIAKDNFISLDEALNKAKEILDGDIELEPIDAILNS